MKRVVYVVLILSLIPVVSLYAQDDPEDACPTIVEVALEAVDTACSAIARNQACYGNAAITAEAKPDAADFSFANVGDLASLNDVQSLTLKPLDVEAGEWGIALLRVQANLPDTIPGQNVTVLLFGDVQITEAPDSPGPMQAVYFRSGTGDSPCVEAPESGMLIQTPEGVVEVTMTINGVDMQIGSTAFLQAIPADEEADGQLIVNMLEGQATITANDSSVTIPAGMFSTVPLDEDLQAIDIPTEPQAYDAAAFRALPLHLVEREIEIIALAEETETPTSGVTPLSGTWLYTSGELGFSADCPAELTTYMPQYFPQIVDTFELDWSGGFTIETYLEQAALQSDEPIPAGANLTNPEPGVIVIEYAEEGASIVTEMRVISERLIETVMVMNVTEGLTCTVTIPATMEYQGE